MSLSDKITAIVKYIEANKGRVEYNKTIFDILEGNLLPSILISLQRQLSEDAYKIAKERIPPINLLKRIIDKLSKIYNVPPERTATKPDSNQELVDWYSKEIQIDTNMGEANKYFNAMKYVALETYTDTVANNKINVLVSSPKLRVLAPHQFLPYSDDIINPLRITVFIKFMGTAESMTSVNESKEVEIYYLYSNDEFLIVDSDKEVRTDIMSYVGADGTNPYGRIPFTYISKSRQELIPQIDSDTLALAILIPILLTDLNFATQFNSFSIIYGVDIDLSNIKRNPNAFWDLKSSKRDDAKPEIGTIKPSVDIEKVLKLIQETLTLWLETRSIRAKSSGSITAETAASGISLMIQEIDTTEDRQNQKPYFVNGENDFWALIEIHQNLNGFKYKNKGKFSKDFDIVIQFAEDKILEDRSQKVKRLKEERDAGFISTRQSIKNLNPGKSDEEIEAMIVEIDEEKEVVIEPVNTEQEQVSESDG